MAMIKCKECGKDISDTAKVCINCGAEIKNLNNTNTNGTNAVAGIIAFVVIGLIVWWVGSFIFNSIDDKLENASVSIKYQTNPITGETEVTEINGKNKIDAIDGIMDWLGFEKVEK